jgi:hypothetical protein
MPAALALSDVRGSRHFVCNNLVRFAELHSGQQGRQLIEANAGKVKMKMEFVESLAR